MAATIYHNPRCSKSRKTLAILQEKEIETTIVNYLKSPPSTETLKQLVKFLGLTPEKILRTNEQEFKDNIKGKNLSENELFQLMNQFPKIIERPIVVVGEKAVIGRPPENVLEII